MGCRWSEGIFTNTNRENHGMLMRFPLTWLVVWIIFIFPYVGNNNPNRLIFSRGVETTNQIFNGPILISMAFLWNFYGISKGFYIWPTGISVPSERIATCMAWMKKLRSAWGPSRSCRVARPLWRSRWNRGNLGKTENHMGNQLGSVRYVKNERWEMIEKITEKLNC